MAAAGVGATLSDADRWTAPDRSNASAVTSDRCRTCHPAQHESWHRTYHRTMTQSVTDPAAVLAPFAGETVDAHGFRATMTRTAAGVPHVRIQAIDDDGRGRGPSLIDADIAMTVGSHRYQQYVAQIDRGGGPGEMWRVPVAWFPDQSRWVHLSAAFLAPDPALGSTDDYLRHFSRYNDNCLFCHNTEAAPGKDADGRFETEIGELGIACEACHGAGSAHVQRHGDLLRRILSDLGDDGSVANPGRLDPGTSSGVCGRCHGQRIARDVRRVLRHGDGFVPGTDLADVSRPIYRDSALGSDPPGAFAARFWPDGTPRLSAYEYQGLLLSGCYADGTAMGCGTCHSMHESDKVGQVRPRARTFEVCQDCHEDLSGAGTEAEFGTGHGGHGDAVDCGGCHMPRTSYGLIRGLISHRITTPDPQAFVGRNDMPDACTQCHVDKTRAWAAAAMATVVDPSVAPPPPSTGPSRVQRDVVGGDPIQRALAVHALTRPSTGVDVAVRIRSLTEALDDDYPAVRWMAARGLQALVSSATGADPELAAAVAAYDPLADPAARVPAAAEIRRRTGPGPLLSDPAARAVELQRRDDQAIWIGE